MDRREMLQWIGGAVGIHALAGASPERLMAIGRAAHERRPEGSRLFNRNGKLEDSE